jgi:hypothetical protein
VNRRRTDNAVAKRKMTNNDLKEQHTENFVTSNRQFGTTVADLSTIPDLILKLNVFMPLQDCNVNVTYTLYHPFKSQLHSLKLKTDT